MLPEIAGKLPRDQADAIEAGTLASRLNICEALAMMALAKLVASGAASFSGDVGRKYWARHDGVIPVEAVRLPPDTDGAHASAKKSVGVIELTKESSDPKLKLADVQAYYRKVWEHGRRYYSQAVQSAEHFAKRNPSVRGAMAIRLRLEYLALEEALHLVDA